jgi:hypothetical protein
MKKEERGWVVERRLNVVSSAKPTPCPRTTPQQMHAYEVYAYEVYTHEMHARKVLAKTFRSPTLQTVWWLICRDLGCKIRVFALRDKRSLSAAADGHFRRYVPCNCPRYCFCCLLGSTKQRSRNLVELAGGICIFWQYRRRMNSCTWPGPWF